MKETQKQIKKLNIETQKQIEKLNPEKVDYLKQYLSLIHILLWAALLFGAADALKYRLLTTGIGSYYQFLNMLPYFITIVALCMFAKRSNKPACSGVAYRKE